MRGPSWDNWFWGALGRALGGPLATVQGQEEAISLVTITYFAFRRTETADDGSAKQGTQRMQRRHRIKVTRVIPRSVGR